MKPRKRGLIGGGRESSGGSKVTPGLRTGAGLLDALARTILIVHMGETRDGARMEVEASPFGAQDSEMGEERQAGESGANKK